MCLSVAATRQSVQIICETLVLWQVATIFNLKTGKYIACLHIQEVADMKLWVKFAWPNFVFSFGESRVSSINKQVRAWEVAAKLKEIGDCTYRYYSSVKKSQITDTS